MLKFGKAVVNLRIPILIISLILLVPSVWGMAATRINYDMLSYLPGDIDTVKGQDILMDEFGKGAFSFVIMEGMDDKDVAEMEKKIEAVDHVANVLWYDDLVDIDVPQDLLPQKVREQFRVGQDTMLAVFFDTSTSADATMEAITQIRSIAGKQCFVSGMSAMVTDLKALCEKEEPIYVAIAVACSCAAMELFLDSWLVPFIFLGSIGMAILYNMGTNILLGEISYITQALAAILQLAVTMDYSIFLWHSYEEQKELRSNRKEAMAYAIKETITSVVGSSVTTIIGFLALCFMSYKMGLDLGIVMSKGVLLGVIGSVTNLPALVLIFDKPLEKTRHKTLVPPMDRLGNFVLNRFWVFLAAFAIILVPAAYGYVRTPTYYDFTEMFAGEKMSASTMEHMGFLTANDKLKDTFGVTCTHMLLCDANMSHKDAANMLKEIEGVPGVELVLGMDSLTGAALPQELIPDSLLHDLKSETHQMILVNSSYAVSTDACNEQINTLNTVVHRYDPTGMVIGEAPCTKDLIEITANDFNVVNWISIVAIFLVIVFVLKSGSLPVILVAVIEFAIFINLGIPYYSNTSLCFIEPICISTIQLGSTVDYAILMTTRYRKERSEGGTKRDSIFIALTTSIPSILVSALGFFCATFGVALYSDIHIISSICNLMARGAIISMFSVIFILPAMFMLLDKVICKTSVGFLPRKSKINCTEA